LALLANGTADAWGGNEFGDLGDGSSTEGSLLAGPVSGLSEVSAISMGDRVGLALLKNGTVKAWGAPFSAIGDGTGTEKTCR
jgi:alpha-tubulin suppressor-like RCC1 family protein